MSHEYISTPPEAFSFKETFVSRQFGSPDITNVISYEDQIATTETRIAMRGIAAIDTGEKASPNSLGNLRINSQDLPVVARLSFDTGDGKDFVVVDLRSFNLEATNASYKVGPYKYNHTTSLKGGRKFVDKYAADFGLVDLNKVTKSASNSYITEEPITAISMNPDEPTYIVEGNIDRKASAYKPSSFDKSAVQMCSDGYGKLLIGNSVETPADPQVTVHTERPPVKGYSPGFMEFKLPPRANYSRNLFGNLNDDLLNGLFDYVLKGSAARGSEQQTAAPQAETVRDPLETGIGAEIAAMRGEGLSDAKIKSTLMRRYHPDREDGGNPEAAQYVSSYFMKKQEPFKPDGS